MSCPAFFCKFRNVDLFTQTGIILQKPLVYCNKRLLYNGFIFLFVHCKRCTLNPLPESFRRALSVLLFLFPKYPLQKCWFIRRVYFIDINGIVNGWFQRLYKCISEHITNGIP